MAGSSNTHKHDVSFSRIQSAFVRGGFNKFYTLALTNEEFEGMAGYELEEGEYRIGDEIADGTIVGIAISKPHFTDALRDVNLDYLNVVNTEEGIRFGEINGFTERLYPVDISEIVDIINRE